ncbi:MAG: HAD family hydrolase [Actinobacteria bacterium]|nr:HAD family hydrolase [Actinomycetota bacterium]
MTIKLFATDLDGTLLRPDHSVSDFTRETIQRAVDAGIKVVFATGRPTRWLPPVVEETLHADLIIAANGSLIIDAKNREVSDIWQIDPKVAKEVTQLLRARVPGALFAVEVLLDGEAKWSHLEGYRREPGFEERLRDPKSTTYKSIEDWLSYPEPIVKILLRVINPTLHVDEQISLIEQELTNLVEVTTTGSHDFLIEMSPYGINKGSTLAKLAVDMGLSAAEVAAVGDMPNDLSMLEWVGRSATISGGHPAAAAIADRVIPKPTEDGVAYWLSEILAEVGE